MLGYLTKKLDKTKCFMHPLETITSNGVIEMRELKVGDKIAGFEDGAAVLNKVEKVEDIKVQGKFYFINERVLLYENQSVMLGEHATHAKLLKVGDELTDTLGRKVVVNTIRKVDGKHHFYRLKVGGKHTYFLNGILMHNADRYFVGSGNWTTINTGIWSSTSGGASGSSVPSSSDNVFFDAGSAGGTMTMPDSASGNCLDLDCTGFTGTFTTSGMGHNFSVFGNFKLVTTMTYSSPLISWKFAATTTGKTITTAGKLINGATLGRPSFIGIGGGWILQDDWTSTASIAHAAISLDAGTLDLNGKTMRCFAITSAVTTSARGIIFNGGTLIVGSSNTGTSPITLATTNLTWTQDTGLLVVEGTQAATFAGGGVTTFGHVLFKNVVTNIVQTISGANTFKKLTFDTSSFTMTIRLTASVTQTVSENIYRIGKNVCTIDTTTGGTPATISCPSDIRNMDYCAIKDITVTGGATYYAGNNSTSTSGNSGWIFGQGASYNIRTRRNTLKPAPFKVGSPWPRTKLLENNRDSGTSNP